MRKLLAAVFLLSIYTCNNSENIENSQTEKKQVSTEIVNNPVTASGEYDNESLPAIKFDAESFDFGVIIQGERVSHTFNYTNAGGSDLVITSARGSCGCTVPKFSKAPLAPGEKGEIEIIFDSSGRSGMQKKTVVVLANTQPNTVRLTITAEIVVPKTSKN